MPPKPTLIVLSLLAATNVSAVEPSPIALGARLAATCAACHGTAGDTRGSTLPRLAGQPQQAISASLQAFKTGKRESTIMTQIAKGYTDEQIELLASYFAGRKEAK
jgi:cytochrome c553